MPPPGLRIHPHRDQLGHARFFLTPLMSPTGTAPRSGKYGGVQAKSLWPLARRRQSVSVNSASRA